jgi:hypothetical protein
MAAPARVVRARRRRTLPWFETTKIVTRFDGLRPLLLLLAEQVRDGGLEQLEPLGEAPDHLLVLVAVDDEVIAAPYACSMGG